MGELEQMAIRTFSIVPEIYQQAFRDAGTDFPDQLVGQIKQDPNQAMELLNSDKDLLNAVVKIYKNNQEAINQYAEQASSQMFKKGGKLAYGLEKFKCGGKTSKKVKKAQDGTKNQPFTELPIRTYNENGIYTPNWRNIVENSKVDRTFTFAIPTTMSDINHITNQSRFAWNPQNLDTNGFTVESYRYLTSENPNERGQQIQRVKEHSIRPQNSIEVKENGGKTKKYQVPSGPLPEEKTEMYSSSPDEYIQLKTNGQDSTLTRFNSRFTPIEAVTRFYSISGTPMNYNHDWNYTSEGASEKFEGLKALWNKAKKNTYLRKIQ